MRRAAKVDANQDEIVQALRGVGAFVQSLAKVGDGCPDLLIGWNHDTYLVEVKRPGIKGKLRPSQVDWHKDWRGTPVFVLETGKQALNMLGFA